MYFTKEPLQEILSKLQNYLLIHNEVSFKVFNPDLQAGYAGKNVKVGNQIYLYRSLKSWCELSELLYCKMLLPKAADYPMVTLTFKKLQREDSFHLDSVAEKEEKYGVTSSFFTIHKMEEPSFYYYYAQALDNVLLEKRRRVLNLGVNRGDEFEVIRKKLNANKYYNMEFVGIDHSKTAIEYAQGRFEEKNVQFYAEDINNLDTLHLGKFDLLISIGTMQSPNINFKPFFMKLVQNYLEKDAAIILGFPNSRWIGGEIVYGAKVPNYAMSEMGHLLSDVMFCKKYLQQKRYRVTITGKHYLFLTATKIM